MTVIEAARALGKAVQADERYIAGKTPSIPKR